MDPELMQLNSNVPPIRIKEDKFTIGRNRECDVVIKDINISRTHCVIEKKEGKWFITNKSSNGIKLNSTFLQRDSPTELKNNFKIDLTPNNTEPMHVYKFMWDSNNSLDEATIIEITESFLDDSELDALCRGKPLERPPRPKRSFSPVEVIDLVDVKLKTPVKAEASTSKAAEKPPAPDLEDELTCSICTEIFIQTVTLNCRHSFCSYCIKMWRKNSNLCPICRTKITMEVPSLCMENIIEKVLDTLSLDDRKRREEIVKERSELEKPKETKSKKRKKNSNSRRGAARSRAGSSRVTSGPAPPQDPIDISSSEDDTIAEVQNYLDIINQDYYDDDEDYYDDYEHTTGVPGAYFGGYGECYICHMPGHWANGCPTRFH